MTEALVKMIKEISIKQGRCFVAIDGRCGAGKTTYAKKLSEKLLCPVIHMDDFFLRPEQRNPERLNIPGGNIDYERFIAEVLIPLKKGENFCYRAYNCQKQALDNPTYVDYGSIIIVEGSYSCHPELWEYYDLHIFIDVDSEEQLRRLRQREGEGQIKAFTERWIPLEEKYFLTFKIKDNCDVVI